MVDMEQTGIAEVLVRTDRGLARAAARSCRYVQVQLRAARVEPRAERAPVQVAFALDRSGSMRGAKIELARRAVLEALGRLGQRDRFAITTFDSEVAVVMPASWARPAELAQARVKLSEVEPRGNTALHGGWRKACEEIKACTFALPEDAPVKPNYRPITRCLLITDGQANAGPSDPGTLAQEAAEQRRSGVVTSALGIGEDFNEELLSAMARAGGGQFVYVANAAELAEVLQREVGDALEVAAPEVVVEVWPSPGVRLELLNDFPAEWTGTHLRVPVGDLTSEQLLDLSLQVVLPTGAPDSEASVEVRLSDADGPLELPVHVVSWTLAEHDANDRQPRDMAVLRQVAEVMVARARLDVVRLNRRGDFDRVRAKLDELLVRLRHLGPDDPRLCELAAEVERDRDRLSRWSDERSLKELHMTGTSVSRSRDAYGRSRKSSTIN